MMSILVGILIVATFTVLAVGGLLLVRRTENRITVFSNESAGATVQVVGTLYAVLLGLLVVQAMSDFDNATQLVESEIGSLDNISILVDVFPEEDQRKIQLLIHRYLKTVIEDEWKLMREHRVSIKTWELPEELWSAIKELKPQNEIQIATFSQLLASYTEFQENRRQRLHISSKGVSPVLFMVLLVGALAVLAYPFFYGLENVRAEAFMVGLMSVTLSLNFYLWVNYSDPFSGIKTVSPKPFEMYKRDLEYYFKTEGVRFAPGSN